MTRLKLHETVLRSGERAERLAESIDSLPGPTLAAESAVAQWMQVKMLAEIALQLRIMNDGNGCPNQPEE